MHRETMGTAVVRQGNRHDTGIDRTLCFFGALLLFWGGALSACCFVAYGDTREASFLYVGETYAGIAGLGLVAYIVGRFLKPRHRSGPFEDPPKSRQYSKGSA
jgi:hypothetical protein